MRVPRDLMIFACLLVCVCVCVFFFFFWGGGGGGGSDIVEIIEDGIIVFVNHNRFWMRSPWFVRYCF